jgi:glycosyltransferase involved in cell wall biosynthesis
VRVIKVILTVCLSNSRGAGEDMYKNFINFFPQKENLVCVFPYGYSEDEFSSDVFIKIKENVTAIDGKLKQIVAYKKMIEQLKLVIDMHQIQCVYLHFENFIFNSLFVNACPNIHFTLWYHDPILHDGSSLKEKILRFLSKRIFINKIENIVVSYAGALEAIQRDKAFSKKNKFHVIFLPQMPSMEFPDLVNSGNIKYDFIFYGRIEKYKGINLLLSVLKDDKLKNVKLLIVGRGREEDNIRAICQVLKNVEFINEYVPDAELAKYITMAKFVILPYKTATGSQTIQIANYYNKLVLATKVGCFSEYINSGGNGFLVDEYSYTALKESILRMMNIDTQEYMTTIQREYQKFNISNFADKLYKVIVSK